MRLCSGVGETNAGIVDVGHDGKERQSLLSKSRIAKLKEEESRDLGHRREVGEIEIAVWPRVRRPLRGEV